MNTEKRKQYLYKLFIWLNKQLEKVSNWELDGSDERIINKENSRFHIHRTSYMDQGGLLIIDIFFVVYNDDDGPGIKYDTAEYTEFMVYKDVTKFRSVINSIFSDLILEKNNELLYEKESPMYSFIDTLSVTAIRGKDK